LEISSKKINLWLPDLEFVYNLIVRDEAVSIFLKAFVNIVQAMFVDLWIVGPDPTLHKPGWDLLKELDGKTVVILDWLFEIDINHKFCVTDICKMDIRTGQ
jgi:hypothetical protein